MPRSLRYRLANQPRVRGALDVRVLAAVVAGSGRPSPVLLSAFAESLHASGRSWSRIGSRGRVACRQTVARWARGGRVRSVRGRQGLQRLAAIVAAPEGPTMVTIIPAPQGGAASLADVFTIRLRRRLGIRDQRLRDGRSDFPLGERVTSLGDVQREALLEFETDLRDSQNQRSAAHVAARTAQARVLDALGYSTVSIAGALKVHHSTVAYYLGRAGTKGGVR